MELPVIEVESVPIPKTRNRWKRWLVIFSIGVFGSLIGWNESGKNLNDSQADVQAVELAIGNLLDAASADKMPQIITRDEFVSATENFSRATFGLQDYASNLKAEQEGTSPSIPIPAGFKETYPTYDSAWDRFLTAFGRLHTWDNQLKATILYYDAVSWYPRPPTDSHDWQELNQSIKWQLTERDTPERVGYAIGSGSVYAIFAWFVGLLIGWVWSFLLARIRDVSKAVRGV
jgi:hypothetical protein